jgi:hypothetical protein
MTKKSYDDMVSRAIVDPKFRAALLKDPEGTIKAENYDVPPDALDKLKNLDPVAAEAAIKDIEAGVTNRKAAV